MKKMNAIEKYNRLIDLSNTENEEFESLENSELYGYEDNETYGYEELEELEDFRRLPRRGYGSRRLAKPAQYRRFGMPSVKTSNPQLMRAGTTPKPNSVVAQFDIKITRTSYDIRKDLPVILFSSISVYSGYKGLLNVPSGLTVSANPLNGDIIYNYTEPSTGNSDEITISCSQVPYIDLLNGLFVSEFDIFKMRIITPSATVQSFISQPLGTIRRTMFGKVSDIDTIPFISQKGPGDFAQNIIDVDLNIHMQNDKGLTYVMPQVNDTITFSFFVDNLIKK